MSRKWIRAVLLLAGAVLTLVLTAATVPAATPGGKLSKEERAAIGKARAEGESTVTMLFATQPGQAKTVVDGLEGLGAKVRVPRRPARLRPRCRRARQGRSGARACGGRRGRHRSGGPAARPAAGGRLADRAVRGTGAATPRVNPYMPTRTPAPRSSSTRTRPGTAAASRSASSTPASRSTTRACTPRAPASARSSTGSPAPTRSTDDDPTWINMAAQVSRPVVHVRRRHLHRARRGVVPHRRFSTSATRGFGGEVGNDVNRDGNPCRYAADIFAVLWNATTDQVWVDTNQNRSFADETGDDATTRSTTTSATSAPTTRRRRCAERMPFVVQTDGKNKFVNIGIVSGAHGSHVAGITAGNGLFGGAMSGAAPGAKIVSVARLPVHRRLHRARPDRGHDLRRQAGATSTSSTCRSAACRRSTTATTRARALRPADRAVQRADVHLGRATAVPA